MAGDENNSWMQMQLTSNATSWSGDEDEAEELANGAGVGGEPSTNLASFNPLVAQHFRTLTKRIREVYENEGEELPATQQGYEEWGKCMLGAVAIKKRKVDRVFNGLRLAKNVDLCFLVDITNSMKEHLNAVKESIFKIVDSLLEKKEGVKNLSRLRLAFVGYKDFGSKKQFSVLKFTPFPKKFRNFCEKINTAYGFDVCEDVFGGLEKAIALNWHNKNSGTKLIFHICDAPCHGRKFHTYVGTERYDRYPDGDPEGRTADQLFNSIREKGILYHFGKINKKTNLMVEKFEQVYKDKISVYDIKNTENISDAIIESVRESVIFVCERFVGARKNDMLHERDYEMHSEEPNWDEIETIPVKFLCFYQPRNISDIAEDVPLRRKNPEIARIQVAKHPFSRGVERIAFYGRDIGFPFGDQKDMIPRDMIFKEYRYKYNGNILHRFETANQVQTIAAYLANRFCEQLRQKSDCKLTIEFLKTKILVIEKEGETIRYMACEKRFSPNDQFIRFSNNVNYSILESKAVELGVPIEYVDLLMAFSHWTYQATNQMLMVVDLQGIVQKIGTKIKVVLTDPAIHCVDLLRYGSMNLGRRGIANFFNYHRCNKFCPMLELTNKLETVES